MNETGRDEYGRDWVRRFVITHVGDNGYRVIATALQGRCTYATREEAQALLDAMHANNSRSTLESVYNVPTLEVRPMECYPVHFDPIGTHSGTWEETC